MPTNIYDTCNSWIMDPLYDTTISNKSTNTYTYNSSITTGPMGSDTITISGPTGASGPVGPGGAYSDSWTISTDFTSPLKVNGDIIFDNDRSLTETIDKIEQRLAILRPNPELESKWDRLKELGDLYRALEKDILEKEKIVDILKK